MAEYIDREKLIDAIKNDCSEMVYYTKSEAIDCINAEPAADVAPVVHGKWVNTNKEVEQMCKCSACGYPISYFWSRTPYCPHCGAKMDKEG